MSKKETLHIYCRCSTKQQIENSIERQKKNGIDFAKSMGWKYKLYIDEGKSRFLLPSDREGLAELFYSIENDIATKVWIEDFSRLSGEISEFDKLQIWCQTKDLEVYEGLRGNQQYRPNDGIASVITLMMSQIGSQMKKDEIKKSIQTKIDKFNDGYHMLGEPSFGYKLVDKRLVIEPSEAKWVKKIFQWYLNGKSIAEIRDEMVLSRMKTKRNGKNGWSKANIHIILNNEHYIGKTTYTDKTKDRSRDKRLGQYIPIAETDRWVTHTNELPNIRIVSDELFTKVQKKLKPNKLRLTKREYLLHSKIVCECGKDWVGRWYHKYDKPFYFCINSEHKYYRNDSERKHLHNKVKCNNPKRIDGHLLDEFIWDNLIRTLENSSLIKEKVKKNLLGEKYGISSIRKTLNKDIRRVEKEIKTFENNRVQFLKDKYINNISDKDFRDIEGAIRMKIIDRETELKKLRTKETIMNKRSDWIDWIEVHKKNIETYRTIFGKRERRRVIDFYINNITIGYNRTTMQHSININYRYPIVGDTVIRKGGRLNWDKWGNGYKVKDGEKIFSIETTDFFFTSKSNQTNNPKNYQRLLNSYRFC
jgi:site-specific DNA recombinase